MKKTEGFFASPPSLALGAVLLATIALLHEPVGVPASAPAPVGERLAVAAVGVGAATEISPMAGHAPYFLVFETGVGLVEVVENDFASQAQAVGTRAGYLISALEVDGLVAGRVGPRLRTVLEAEGISFIAASGPAEEVAAELLARSESSW